MTSRPPFMLDRPEQMDDRSRTSETGLVTDTPVAALDETLRFVQMSGMFYCPSELTEPWGLTLPPTPDCVWFHVVTAGAGTVAVDSGERTTMRTGDLVLVPHGTGHSAFGAEPAPTPSVFDLPHEYESEHYGVLRHGGGGALTRVVCGGVRFEHPAARQLVGALPPIIKIEYTPGTPNDWMRSTLDLLADETLHPRPGSHAVVSRLCDVLVIQAIRAWIERDPAAQTGWLGALRDPQIGRVIAALHADPGRVWTLRAMAAEASMSRSAFAARFTALVGEPAMQYVTRWRMHVALDLLQRGGTVAAVARDVGYDSEAAFSRAFRRTMGSPPRARASA